MSDEQKKGDQKNLDYIFKKMMGVKKFYGGGGGKNFLSNKKRKRSAKNFAYTFKTEVMTSKNGSI